MAAPVKKSHILPPRRSDISTTSENSNPNLPILTPGRRKSTAVYLNSSKKSIKSLKSLISPCSAQQNKFIVKKKLSLKDSKASCSKNQSSAPVLKPHAVSDRFVKKTPIRAPQSTRIVLDRSENRLIRNSEAGYSEIQNKNRDLKCKIAEETLTDAPEPGEGRVKYLVKAFERLFTKKEEEGSEGEKRDFRFVQIESLQKTEDETETSQSRGSTSAEMRAIEKSEVDSGEQIESICNRKSNIANRSNRIKRNSTGSSGRSFTKKAKVTSLHPFMLKTEERGRVKEENFMQKIKAKIREEERLRIPVAQGLPLTTDEPQYPFKPPIKEPTEPLDLILHSDIRAIERAEFDNQVAEKINFIEKLKMERERQLKMEEEEEIRRLRQELVPRAQPMPRFDKPFIPKRSIIPSTVPKEPKFHARPPRHNKS